jgi:hypothetical protein
MIGSRPSDAMRRYLRDGILLPIVQEWAALADYRDACRILAMHRDQRVAAIKQLPQGRRERVTEHCKTLYKNRLNITKES